MVLEVDEENGTAEEARREDQVFAAIGMQRVDVAQRYWSVSYPGLYLEDEDSRAYLRAALETYRPDVLMLDTGTSMVGDEWGVEFKGVMRFIQATAAKYRCAVVIFVHLVKGSKSGGRIRAVGTDLTDVIGTWTRSVDVVALLADLGQGHAAWTLHKKVPRSELVLARAEGLWTVVRVGVEREPASDQRVLQAIDGGARNPKEIAAEIGLGSRAVSNAISRLRTSGRLNASHPYEITQAGRDSLP